MEGFRAWGFQSSSGVVPPPPASGWLLDGNTEGAEHYIGTDDAFDFPIRTNGVEIARFLTTGKLGLGVVIPTERLQVAGNIAPEANGTRDLGTPALGWLNLYLSSNIHYQSTLVFQSGGTQKLSLDTSGFMLFNNNQGLDVVTTVGVDVLNIGTGNADIINIGWSGANINIMGNTFYENVTQLQVKDKLFTVNKGGAIASGASAGFEIEEGDVITGQFSTSATRDGWYFLAPAIASSATLSLAGLLANQTLTVQNASGTIAYLSDIPAPLSSWLQNGNTNGVEKYIGTNDNFDFPIRTNNIERARILKTGEFGIGTSTPTAKFHVQGAGNTLATYTAIFQNSSLSKSLQIRDDGNVYSHGNGAIASNTAYGLDSFSSNLSGADNTAFGVDSLRLNTTGGNNTAVGKTALYNNNGSFNTAIGFISLELNTSGERNSASGYGALSVNTSGFRNTAIGMFSGNGNITGDNNVFVGYGANPLVGGLTNAIAIGSGAIVSASNTMVLGNGVNVAIGDSTASARLHVKGIDATTLINTRLEPVTNVTEDTTGATVATTDATTTTLQTIAIPTDTGLMIECYVTARKTAGVGIGTIGDVNGYVRIVKAKNVGGVVTIGAVQTSFTSEDIAFNATLDVRGTDVRVRVSGATNDNVTWNVITKTYKVA